MGACGSACSIHLSIDRGSSFAPPGALSRVELEKTPATRRDGSSRNAANASGACSSTSASASDVAAADDFVGFAAAAVAVVALSRSASSRALARYPFSAVTKAAAYPRGVSNFALDAMPNLATAAAAAFSESRGGWATASSVKRWPSVVARNWDPKSRGSFGDAASPGEAGSGDAARGPLAACAACTGGVTAEDLITRLPDSSARSAASTSA